MSQPERGGMPTPHPQGVPMVNPQPLQFQTTITGAQFPVVEKGDDENKLVLKEHVVLFHSTPAGTAIMVWDIPAAEKIAKDVYAACHRMKSNIILPNSQDARGIAGKALEEYVQGLDEEGDPGPIETVELMKDPDEDA